jgi:hypothetical protein
MTASQVDGRAVIATERATSNITGHDGQPIRFKQILRLLLEDGTVNRGGGGSSPGPWWAWAGSG